MFLIYRVVPVSWNFFDIRNSRFCSKFHKKFGISKTYIDGKVIEPDSHIMVLKHGIESSVEMETIVFVVICTCMWYNKNLSVNYLRHSLSDC